MSGAEAPVTSADEEVGFRKPGDDKTQPSFLANVVTHRAWSAFFLWVILANTVTMAMMRPTEPADSTWNHRLEVVELVFLVVFTIELAIKLIALGMEFFQDNWNNLDFVIVSTGYLVFLPDVGVNTSVFRTVRVLRPLRSIGMMPGVRILIDALIMSLPGLSTLLVLIFFIYAIFGVMGVQLFKGIFRHHCVPTLHCVTNQTISAFGDGYCTEQSNVSSSMICQRFDVQGNIDPADMLVHTTCKPANIQSTSWTASRVHSGQYGFCSLQNACQPTFDCIPTEEQLHHGATSFDNILTTLVILFQIMTTEGWTTIFQPVHSMESSIVVHLYFISLIFMTSFFMVNFVMAQMVVAFSRAVDVQAHMRPPELSSFDLVVRALKSCMDPNHGKDRTTDVWAMREQFNIVDRDGSGELDEVEIAELATRLGMKLSLPEMDASGDGLISYPEFEGWWRMRGLFDKCDADCSGTLDANEAKQLAEQLGTKFDMSELDQDEDANIEYAEFAAWWNMRNKFNEMDTNHSHTLTSNEVEKLAVDLGMTLSIDDMDKDGDGEISYEEFATWFQVRRAFDKLDRDGSGTLDGNEINALSALVKMELQMSDLDKDSTGEVDYEEFATWWASEGKHKKAAIRAMAVAAQFDYPPGSLGGFVMNPVFQNAVLVIVVANFMVLATDHYLMDPDIFLAIEMVNLAFSIFFALEMILKMAGLGLVDYFNDRFNTLDFCIVLMSLVEMIFMHGGAVTSMRTLRLIRVFRSLKIFGASPNLKKLLEVTTKSGAAIMNFALLLFFFIVIYALVGMNMFGDELKSPVYQARGRFDNFYWSFLTVFQVLTRENWHELLYTGYGSHGWTSFLYFASLIVVTNYMILSLFLGNLLHTLEDVFMREAAKIRSNAVDKMKKASKTAMKMTTSDATVILSAAAFKGDKLSIQNCSSDEDRRQNASLIIQREWAKYRMRLENQILLTEEVIYDGAQPAQLVEVSCGLFPENNSFRWKCTKLSTNPAFTSFVMCCILASSITLAVEHPADNPESSKVHILFIIDVVLTAVFVMEGIVTAIVKGVIAAPGAYLRNTWDQVDFMIVVVSVIGLLPFADDFKVLRILRTFRVLRPLRALRRFPQLCTLTQALFSSLVPVAIVGCIALFATTIFAVVFVALLKGRTFSCSADHDAVSGHHTQYIQFGDCVGMGGTWQNADQRYDNVLYALLTLFEVMTMEDWITVMYDAIDTTSTPTGFLETFERAYRGTPLWGVGFMFFVIVGAFFFLNLLVGVVVNAFNMEDKMEETGADRMEAVQRRRAWMISMVTPIRVTSWYENARKPCHSLMLNSYWDIAVGVCIILNVLVMATEHAEESTTFSDIVWWIGLVFSIIFTVELLVKLIALHPLRCFMDRWNIFDGLIVTVSWVEVAVWAFGQDDLPINPTVLRSFRIFRLTRLIKLVPHSEGLQAVFHTFIEALPVLGNVGILMATVFFMYDVLAVQLFSGIPYTDGEMNEFMNFQNFGRAFFTLFVLATGEHWNAIMHEVMNSDDGPGIVPTVTFFVSFQFLAVFLTLNLFISVVVAYTQKADHEKWEKAQQHVDDRPTRMEWTDIDSALIAWAELDPTATGAIHGAEELRSLVLQIGSTGSVLGAADEAEALEIMEFVGAKRYTGRLYFSAVLHMLAAKAFGSVLPAEITFTPRGEDDNVTTNPLNEPSDDGDSLGLD